MESSKIILKSLLLPSIFIITQASLSYNDDSCAYFSTHVVATPLTKCSSYSYKTTQYSWNFVCDTSSNVNIKYFMSDTQCTSSQLVGQSAVDTSAGEVQCKGSGSNCHTVDITVYGFTDTSSCEDDTDYYEFSFVVDECIPSYIGGNKYSAKLSCDSEKLWFDYWSDSDDCMGNMQTYTYEYYKDINGCWDIYCGQHEEIGTGTYSNVTSETPPEEPPACTDNGLNNHEMGKKLIDMITKPLDFNKARYITSQKKAFAANVINDGAFKENVERSTGFIANKLMMNWIYIAAVSCGLILIAGAWRFIKQKEYTML